MAHDVATDKQIIDVEPSELERWISSGDATLVDVREYFEHAEEHIRGAELVSLSEFDPRAVRDQHSDERVVFYCRSGKRSAEAAQRYAMNGEPVYHLAGGIEQWKSSGLPVVRPASPPGLPVMRQVQLIAGSLVVIGVVLGALVNWWFLALSAFVGLGLTFAGATGWCGMALMLSRMPWNRPKPNASRCEP